MNQRYVSKAIIPDGSPEPEWKRDKELYFQASARPGAHLPHVWLGKNGHKISTLDISGHGKFTLLTGIGGQAWVDAANAVAAKLDIELNAIMIGAGCEFTDLYGAWADAREIEESGCLLVRPDLHIAWRQPTTQPNAEKLLLNALNQVLGK